jgi:chromosome segregation ATPase
MRTRLGELWAEVRRQVAEVSDLREENTSLKETLREGNRQIRQLRTNTEEYEDLLQIRGREMDQLRERLSNQGTQSNELQGALDDKSAGAAKLEEALEQQALELHELKVERDALRQERDQATNVQHLCHEQHTIHARCKSELDACKADLQRANRTAAAEKRKAAMDLHVEIDALKKSKAKAETRRAELNEQFTDEKSEWMEQQKQIEVENARLVGELEDELVRQMEELQELKGKGQKLQEEFNRAKDSLSAKEAELAKHRARHSLAQQEKEKLAQQVQEVLGLEGEVEEEGELEVTQSTLKCLQELEVGQMRLVWKQIKQSNRAVARAQQESEGRLLQVTTLERERALLQTKLVSKDKRCDELQKEALELTIQVQKNVEDYEKIGQTSASLQQHAHQLESQYEKVSAKLKKVQEALGDQKQVVAEQETTVAGLQGRWKGAQKELAEGRVCRERLEKEISSLRIEVVRCKGLRSEEGSSSSNGGERIIRAVGQADEAGLAQMVQRCDRLQNAKEQLEGQVKKMQQQTLSHCLTLRAVEKQHKEQEKQHEDQSQLQKERVQRLEIQHAGIKAAACSLEKELKGQMEAAKVKHDQEMKTTVTEYKERCIAVRNSRKEQQEQLLQLQERYSEQMIELEEQKTVSLELQRAFDKLQQTLEVACVEREQLRQWQKERQQVEGKVRTERQEKEKMTEKMVREQEEQQATRLLEQKEHEATLRENEIECEQLRKANSVMFKTVQAKGRAWKDMQKELDASRAEKDTLTEEVRQLQEKHRSLQQQRKEQRSVEVQYREDVARQQAALESKIQKLEVLRGHCEHKHVDKKQLGAVEEKRVAAELRMAEAEREKSLLMARWEQEKVLHEQLKQDRDEKARFWQGQEEKLKLKVEGRETRCFALECSVAKLEGRLKTAEKLTAEAKMKGEAEVMVREREVSEAKESVEAAARKALEGHEAALKVLREELSSVKQELKTQTKREERRKTTVVATEAAATKRFEMVVEGLRKEVGEHEVRCKNEEEAKVVMEGEMTRVRGEMKVAVEELQTKVGVLETEIKERDAEKGRNLELMNAARMEKSRALKALAAMTKSHSKDPGTCQGCAELVELKAQAHVLKGRAQGVEKIKESLKSAMKKSELQVLKLKADVRETEQLLARVETELRESKAELRESKGVVGRQSLKLKVLEEELVEQSKECEAAQEGKADLHRKAEERCRQYEEQADLLRVQVEDVQTRAATFEGEVSQLQEANSLGEHVWKKAEMERSRLSREARILEEEVAEQSKECVELQQRNRQLRRELLTVHSYFGVSVSPQAMMAQSSKVDSCNVKKGRPFPCAGGGKSLTSGGVNGNTNGKAVCGVGKIKDMKAQAQLEEARQRNYREAEMRAHEMLQMKLEDLNSSSQQNMSLRKELERAKEEVQQVKEQVAAEQAKRLFQLGVLSYKKEQNRTMCPALS